MLEILQKYSYFGLFGLLFLEEGGIPLPIPGDIFIAAVAGIPGSSYLLTVTTVIAATLSGSTILFSLSKKFGAKILNKFIAFFRVNPKKIKRVEKWFEKYGSWAIIIGRLIPGLRIITPITAGLFNIDYKKFWAATTIAAFIWANVYFFIGKFGGTVVQKLF